MTVKDILRRAVLCLDNLMTQSAVTVQAVHALIVFAAWSVVQSMKCFQNTVLTTLTEKSVLQLQNLFLIMVRNHCCGFQIRQ